MGIKINDPSIVPAVTLDHFHLDQLLMSVDRITSDYKVIGTGVTFGLDAEGDKYFSRDIRSINDDTFLSTAITRAITLGEVASPEEFEQKAIEARTICNNDSLTTAEALVAFENAIKVMFIIAGNTDMGNLE